MTHESSLLKFFIIVLLTVVVTVASIQLIVPPELMSQQTISLQPASHVKLIVLFDDHPYDNRLKAEHGFSCLVAVDGCTILFDAGGDPEILAENAKALKINFSSIDVLFISHDHSDHIAGLQAILPQLKEVSSYVPQGAIPELVELLSSKGRVYAVLEPTVIGASTASTGVFPYIIAEHALLIRSSKGLIMVVGSAHPGVLEMAKRAIEITQCRIHLLIGGMYLPQWKRESLIALAEDLKSLGVEYIAPLHCSSNELKEALKKVFGDHYLNAGVSFTYEVSAHS